LDRHGDPLPQGAVARLGTVRLWHGPEARTISFAPDGKTVVTAGAFEVRVWDAATGQLIRQVPNPDNFLPGEAQYAPDGKTILVLECRGRQVCVSDAETGRIHKVLERPAPPPERVVLARGAAVGRMG